MIEKPRQNESDEINPKGALKKGEAPKVDHTLIIEADHAEETLQKGKDQQAISEIKSSLGISTSLKNAEEIMGDGQLLGPDKVSLVFGVELDEREMPKIPYTRVQLKEAKENGELLILRIDKMKDGKPLNLKNLVASVKPRIEGDVKSEEFSDPEFWLKNTDFAKNEVPRLEWKLVSRNKIEGTNHLSLRAQNAFISKDMAGIETEMEDTKNYWQEIWGDNFERGPDEGVPVREALSNMPSLAEVRNMMESLPDKASLPTVTEVIYDQLLYMAATGKPLFQGRAVATKSSVPPMEGIDDNVRPWDISFSDDGEIIIHFRRSDRMGRPHQLGNLEVGIPISYIQH